MTGFWLGVLATFGAVGGLVVGGGLAWLAVVSWPEVVWWSVSRLPLQDDDDRDRAAAIVAGSRRAYVLRIFRGVRIAVSLGGDYDDQFTLYEDLRRARRLAKVDADA